MRSLVLTSLIIGPVAAFPAWEPIGPAGAGYGLMSIVQSYEDAGILYAVGGPVSAGNFVLAFDDPGGDWTLLSAPSGIVRAHPGSMAMTPDGVLIFLNIGHGSIATSTDLGLTWSWASFGSYADPNDVCTVPGSQDHAWIAGRYRSNSSTPYRARIWTTADSGLSWSGSDMMTTPSEVFRVSVCSSAPTYMFAAGKLTSPQLLPLLLGSSDGGAGWSVITPPEALSDSIGLAVAVSPDDPLLVLFSTSYNLYRSTNGGQAWSVVSTEDKLTDIQFSDYDPDLVFAAGEGVILRSSNAGETWIEEVPGPDESIRAVCPSRTDPSRVFACTEAGFRYSNDGGDTWLLDNDGMMLRWTSCLTASTGSSNRLCMFVDGVFSVSDDLGETWNQRTTPAGMNTAYSTLAVNPYDEDEVICVDYSGRIYRTPDGGASWGVQDSTLTWGGDAAAHPAQDGVFFACGRVDISGDEWMSVGRSDDGGLTWAFEDLGDSPGSAIAIAYDPVRPDTVYVGGSYHNMQGSILMRSTDGGADWSEVQTPVGFYGIYDIAVNPFDPDAILLAGYDGIFRSSDFGATWTKVVDCQYPSCVLFDPQMPQLAWYYQDDMPVQGVCVSYDAGLTWETWNEGLVTWSNLDVLALVPGEYLFASTACGAWRLDLGEEGAGGGPQPGPATLSVFPNPVAGACSITYRAEAAGRVEFGIYDLAGRLVAHFADEPETPGVRSLQWDPASAAGGDLASGIYFLQMHSAQGTSTARFTLLR